jgi:Flp pilus assembly protein TadD
MVSLVAVACAQGCAGRARPAVPSAHAIQPVKSVGITIESHDRTLSAALLALNVAPSAARHRAVAKEYRRLHVDDAAFDHLKAATRLDPADAAAYDELARIWRDWGFPHLGLGDSARAVYYAPDSAAVHNTRGTLLAAIGDVDAARREFQQALSLDSNASFAAANLCRLEQASKPEQVSPACRQRPADGSEPAGTSK